MRILICTGIYPPQIGGPAQYAYNIKRVFENRGHVVVVRTYSIENFLPPLVRHIVFFVRVLFSMAKVDFVLALDTFSVGWPSTVAAVLLRKKIFIRTGGDFLWESYVERTNDLVLFRDFYKTRKPLFSVKEKCILHMTKWSLHHVEKVIFSSDWQKKIFEEAYGLDSTRTTVVENFYDISPPLRAEPTPVDKMVFVGSTRPLAWKNIPRLRSAFAKAQIRNSQLELFLAPLPYKDFLQKIAQSYAVILVSLGDISPNMILDAIRLGKPFILTRETGLYERLKDVALFVDPEDEDDIQKKIEWLSIPENYATQKRALASFVFVHTWEDIVSEITDIFNKSQ